MQLKTIFLERFSSRLKLAAAQLSDPKMLSGLVNAIMEGQPCSVRGEGHSLKWGRISIHY